MFLFSCCRLRIAPMQLIKCFSVSVVYNKSHYESLGITPHATQNDIKSAYYKMSMQYHPDKNKGSVEAAQKFRDISEAYEILGNLRLRKLYDKGLLHTAGPTYADHKEETMEDETISKFYKSREQRSRPPPPTGRTPIYNFDEWTQMHYGASFARREAAKIRYERKVTREKIDKQDIFLEIMYIGMVCFIVCTLFIYTKRISYDVVEDDAHVKTADQSSSIPQAK